jgi:hypothetical protein
MLAANTTGHSDRSTVAALDGDAGGAMTLLIDAPLRPLRMVTRRYSSADSDCDAWALGSAAESVFGAEGDAGAGGCFVRPAA